MNEQELDQQIRAALEVHPSAEQLARVEMFWKRQSLLVNRNRRRWRLVAVAAAIILALGLLTWLPSTQPGSRPKGTHVAERSLPHATDASTPANTDRSTSEKRSLSMGRAPTVYEQLTFFGGRNNSTDSPGSCVAEVIDQMLESLQQDPATDVEDLVASAGLAGRDYETALLRRLKKRPAEEKAILMRLLAECGSSRSIPLILALGRQGPLRDQAVLAVERIGGAAGLAEAARQATEPELCRALMSRLLAVNDNAALIQYLSLLQHEASRDDALAVAETAPDSAIVIAVGVTAR